MNLLEFNIAHIHLVINHVPTIGMVVGLGLLVVSLARRSEDLQRASLEVLFIVAMLTLPAYLSGLGAQAAIEGRPEVSADAMNAHHDAALPAFALMQLIGAVAWVALWQARRRGRPSRRALTTVGVLSVVTVALLTHAATVGGEIRHPEIRIEESTIAPAGWISAQGVGDIVNTNPWVWPAAETLHFMGMSLLLGVLALVNLRLLGVVRVVSFAALHRLLPWAMLGYAINLATGMLFMLAAAQQYTANNPFYWKVVFLMLAGGNLLYLTVVDKTWTLKSNEEAGLLDKAMAASAIGLWIGVIYFGRMLPFLGNAF